jgi:hypothetical protein
MFGASDGAEANVHLIAVGLDQVGHELAGQLIGLAGAAEHEDLAAATGSLLVAGLGLVDQAPQQTHRVVVGERRELIGPIQVVQHLQHVPVHLVGELLGGHARDGGLVHDLPAGSPVAGDEDLKEAFDEDLLVHCDILRRVW